MDPAKMGKVHDPDFGKRDASREADALLDQKLFGYEIHWGMCGSLEVPYRKGQHDYGMPFSVPYYHSDIKDAWAIVEELRKRGITLSLSSRADLDPSKNNCDDVIRLKDEKYQVQRWNRENQRYDPPVYGKTAEEAICKASMQVLEIA